MKKYLITGATGFVGSCLARALVEQGNDVHLILRSHTDHQWRIHDFISRTTVHISDLSNTEILRKIVDASKPEVIYHLAAYGAYAHQDSMSQAIKTNIEGTWNLFTATMHHDYELFVNTGSSSEYGFKARPMKESDAIAPESAYAITKVMQTQMARFTALRYNKPIVTLRLFSVYGPYEEQIRLVPTMMKHVYEKKTMKLASRTSAHDFIYIDDVIAAYLSITALMKYRGECFNVGTGKQTTLEEMTVLVSRVTNRKLSCSWNAIPGRPWDTNQWVADTSYINRTIGWKARISLSVGLQKMWQWYQSHHQLYEAA